VSEHVVDRIDYKPAQTWQLLEWCMAHGADEFTVTQMSLEGSPAPFCEKFDAKAVREGLSARSKKELLRPTLLWELRPETLAVLRGLFTGGLFADTGDWNSGWLEDPIFYRRGELMLGITSHESCGSLSVTPEERLELANMGFRTRDKPEWMGGKIE
jgi:hypothetical protein